MKEFIHLFTEVKPKMNLGSGLYICLDKDYRPQNRLFDGRRRRWIGTTDPVYVLDLSALTKKTIDINTLNK